MNFKLFNEGLMNELKKETIFSIYWSQELESIIPEELELEYIPTDTIGFYKKELIAILEPITNETILTNTKAEFKLILTSNLTKIDFSKIPLVDQHNDLGEIHAANIQVRIFDSEHYCLTLFEKTLWSNSPSKISGDPKYIKLVI